MAKAIWLMDNPDDCGHCEFITCDNKGEFICTRDKDLHEELNIYQKPDWCPLIELPDDIDSEKLIKLFYKLYDEVVEDGNYDKSKQATLKLIADGIELLNILGMEKE